ncbi:MAG: hypothetical protein HDT13_00295 [Butyrivibrio sp.]|nr:hypothetical protein [Butyrivibrio sp.]
MFRRIRSMSRKTGAIMLAVAIVFGGIAVGIGFASETAYADGETYKPVTKTEFGAAGDFTFVSYADTEVSVHHAGNILCGGTLIGNTNVGTQMVNRTVALPSIVSLGEWYTSVYPENGGAAYYVKCVGEPVGNYVTVKVGEQFIDMDALYAVLDAVSRRYIGYTAGAFNPDEKNGMTLDLSEYKDVEDICIKDKAKGTETYVFDITDLIKSFEGEDSYGSDAYQINIKNVKKNTKVIINVDAEELADKSTINLFKVRVNGQLTGSNGQVAPEFAENIVWNVYFPTTSDANKTFNMNVTEGVGYYLAPNANVTASNCNGAIFANSIKSVGECHSFALSFFEEPETTTPANVTETETTEPEETTPEETTSEEETTPEETTPEESTPEETTSEEETTPEETTPEESTPEETTPEETTPEDTTPEETTTPEQGTTEPTTPEETTTPEEGTTEPTTPEETTTPEEGTTEPEETTTPPEEPPIEIITRTPEVENDEDTTPEEPPTRPRRKGEVEADTGDNSHADIFKLIFGISGVCFAALGIYGLTKKR